MKPTTRKDYYDKVLDVLMHAAVNLNDDMEYVTLMQAIANEATARVDLVLEHRR